MITFVPVGGLANRIRSIQSAISLSGDDELRIYWFKDQGLNCNFYQLFEPIPLQNVTLKETNGIDTPGSSPSFLSTSISLSFKTL